MMNRYGLSRAIPSPVKREVRQRCGFGCVVCGNAIFQYEHFDPEYKDAKSHEANGITLLCPGHHDEKRKGFLAEEQIRACNRTPYTLKHGSSYHNVTTVFTPEIVLGMKTFAGGSSILTIGGELMLGFKPPEADGAPHRLSFCFFGKDDEEVFSIIDNELRCPSDSFDIEIEGNVWSFRSALRKIDLVIRFDLPTRITIAKMNFHYGQWSLAVDGPKMDLMFDGKATMKMSGLVKVVSKCLYELKKDVAGIKMGEGGTMTGGMPPSPIGSRPRRSGDGFEVTWPVYYLVKKDKSGGLILNDNGMDHLGLFLRRSFAESQCPGDCHVETLGEDACAALINGLGQKGQISHVVFNPGCDAFPSASDWQSFVDNLPPPIVITKISEHVGATSDATRVFQFPVFIYVQVDPLDTDTVVDVGTCPGPDSTRLLPVFTTEEAARQPGAEQISDAFIVKAYQRRGFADLLERIVRPQGVEHLLFDPGLGEDGQAIRLVGLQQFIDDNSAPIGRNTKCPCGSGARFKHCHGKL